MAIKDAEQWILPHSDQYADAFFIPNQLYPDIPAKRADLLEVMKIPGESGLICQAAAAYINSGIAFLANKTADPRLREIGAAAWGLFSEGIFRAAISATLERGLEILEADGAKVHQSLYEAADRFPDEPQLLLMNNNQKPIQEEEGAVLLIPAAFILRCRDNPQASLARIAFYSSLARDWLNNRFVNESYQLIIKRAEAFQAKILGDMIKQSPNYRPMMTHRMIMDQYPEGLNSLPANSHYLGGPADGYINARKN